MDLLAQPLTFMFDDFLLDREGLVLYRLNGDGLRTVVPVGSRALEILCLLIDRRGEFVSRREIMQAVWPNAVVEESNLTVQMAALRRVLDTGRTGGSCIQTVSGRGYRFVRPVTHAEMIRPVPAFTSIAERGPTQVLLPGIECIAATAGTPSGSIGGSGREPSSNLPQLTNALIGRSRHVAEIKALLSESRLVTLVGPAGVGKTSLSLQVGADLLAHFPDGIRLVELAPLDRALLVDEAVAAVFGLPVRRERRVADVIATFLRSRRALIILDNCEHVIAAAAKLADTLLKTCPGVFLLATSRERLRVAGEHAYPVPWLDVPLLSTGITAAQAMGHSAVQLFVERAASALGRFALNDEIAPIVAEICRRLDGIPLAIELAAPRLRMLTPNDLLAHLNDQLHLLTGGSRVAALRQQTLRAAIEWSYALLSQAEQAMLSTLGVFAGSFTLEGVAAVAADAPVEAAAVFDVLAGLVDKSLVVSLIGVAENRYRLLESTRAFALEKLDAGRYAALARRLCEHMTIVFERAERSWPTTPRADWLALYEPDLDSLRVALDWSLGSDGEPTRGITLVGNADLLWRTLSLMQEHRRWFELALRFVDDATPPSVEARIRLGIAWDFYGGDRGRLSHVLRAIELLRRVHGEPVLLGQALNRAGNAVLSYTDVREAEQYFAEALSVLRPFGLTKPLVNALLLSGQARNVAGDSQTGRILTEEAIVLSKELGDDSLLAYCEGQLAKIIVSGGGPMADAIDHARRAVEASRGHGTLLPEFMALHRLAGLLILDDQIEPGRIAALRAFELSHVLGDPGLPGSIYELALVLAVRGEAITAARLLGFADRHAEQHQVFGFEIPTWMRSRLVERLDSAISPDECRTAMAAGADWTEREAFAAAEAA